jgi:aspartate aminotransferase
MDLTELLLNEARVAVIPGGPFGADNYIRLSYATSMDHIQKGLDRMQEIIKQIQ